jgi:lincosamide nucleotidyltransferase A/C/D/E
MTPGDVVEVLAALDAGGIDYWVDGGWSIDALLGRQTREHRDLDLGVRLEDVQKIESLLPQFRRESAESGVLLKDERGRVVDLLLVERSESGELSQQLAGGRGLRYEARGTRASGFIGGRRVRCASVALQREHHDHPDATDQDRLDIEVLERELHVKPVRRRSPTLGRFDSCAAPLARVTRVLPPGFAPSGCLTGSLPAAVPEL